MPSQQKIAELDREAHRLRDAGAGGMEFEKLHRQGWTPESQRAGSGLDPCPQDCGVCYPTPEIRERERRNRRRK